MHINQITGNDVQCMLSQQIFSLLEVICCFTFQVILSGFKRIFGTSFRNLIVYGGFFHSKCTCIQYTRCHIVRSKVLSYFTVCKMIFLFSDDILTQFLLSKLTYTSVCLINVGNTSGSTRQFRFAHYLRNMVRATDAVCFHSISSICCTKDK